MNNSNIVIRNNQSNLKLGKSTLLCEFENTLYWSNKQDAYVLKFNNLNEIAELYQKNYSFFSSSDYSFLVLKANQLYPFYKKYNNTFDNNHKTQTVSHEDFLITLSNEKRINLYLTDQKKNIVDTFNQDMSIKIVALRKSIVHNDFNFKQLKLIKFYNDKFDSQLFSFHDFINTTELNENESIDTNLFYYFSVKVNSLL